MKTEEEKKKFREASKRWRENNPEKYKASQKKYREKNKKKLSIKNKEFFQNNPEYYKKWYAGNEIAREKKKKKHREWLDKNKKDQYEASILHSKRHPEKFKARYTLRSAVYRGIIKKPSQCEICMKKHERIEGHHENYLKPLEVKWLCVKCHRNLHIRG